MKIAEIEVEMMSGGYVQDYIRVKTKKQLGRKLDKMVRKGSLDFGAVVVDMVEVMAIRVKWHEVN